LRLPIKNPPRIDWVDTEKAVVIDSPGMHHDSADEIQQAIDSGATSIFLPAVHYTVSRPVILRGKLQRLFSVSCYINYGKNNFNSLRIEDGTAPVVFLEHINGIGGGLEIDTKRTVVLHSVGTHTIRSTPAAVGGEIFLEDVVGDDFRFHQQRVWARQLNIENLGTHLTNDGGDLWVLGYKTERGGTLVHTLNGGKTEILGGFSYTTNNGSLAPMFIDENSSVWSFFGEVCYTNDPFRTIVREIRNGETKEIARNEGSAAPYSGRSK
jgi:hypothetical protein